ncbi:DMT family transporter [Marinomonas epiphytica]
MSQFQPAQATPAYRHIATGKLWYLGVFAALITVCIWASWLVSVKQGAQSVLTTFDLAIMRFAIPAVVLLPIVSRAWRDIIRAPKWTLVGVLVGAGVPFFFLSSQGMHYAPVSHAGLLIPGTFPLFVTAIAVLVFKEPISRPRLFGLLGILCGVATLLGSSLLSLSLDVLKGDVFFIGASFFWAVYTISLRVAGLKPLVATGFLCLVSTLVLLALLIMGGVDSGLQLASTQEIVWQLLVQALCVGLLAGFSYGYAINTLGAERTAAMGALTPVLASFLAIPLLNESVDSTTILGLLFVGVGVVLASGIVKTSDH